VYSVSLKDKLRRFRPSSSGCYEVHPHPFEAEERANQAFVFPVQSTDPDLLNRIVPRLWLFLIIAA